MWLFVICLCMPFSAFWLLFPLAFGSFLSFLLLILWGSFCFLSFLGVTELRLSELSVCYRTVHVSYHHGWQHQLTYILVQHIQDTKIIYLLQSGYHTWPYLSLSFYNDNFLRWQSFSELNLWVWNIIIHFAVLKGFAKILSQSHIVVPFSF